MVSLRAREAELHAAICHREAEWTPSWLLALYIKWNSALTVHSWVHALRGPPLHTHTHTYRRDTDPNTCVLRHPIISSSCRPLRVSRRCVIWVQDAERVFMFYSNNRKSLYYSCVAGKTYGGINSVTVLFNITSPRPGTPRQLENGANHSIKQTAQPYLIYSVLNTIECYFLEHFPQPFITSSGAGLHILNAILVYLIDFITCVFLLPCVMYL